MNRHPFFSIIIPIFNHAEDYLQDAINSIYNSSFKDYEVIIINDGSTDNSLEIIKHISESKSNIFFYSQQNQGQTVARMKGVLKANGQFIIFLDSDDILNSNALSILFNEINNDDKIDMVCFEFLWMRTNGVIESPSDKTLWFQRKTFFGDEKNELLTILAGSYRLNNICCKTIRKTIVEQINFYDLPNVVYGEDKILSLACILSALKIQYIPEYLYYYRRNPKSLMQRQIGLQRIKDFNIFSLYILKECLKKVDVFGPWLNYTAEDYCNMVVDVIKQKGKKKELLKELKDLTIFHDYILPNMNRLVIPSKKKFLLLLFAHLPFQC